MPRLGIEDARTGGVTPPALAGREASGLLQRALRDLLAGMGAADEHMRARAALGMQPDVPGRGLAQQGRIASGVAAAQELKTVIAEKRLDMRRDVARQGGA